MKLIYITARPFYNRDYHRFGLDYLEERGRVVEVWRIMYPNSIEPFGMNDRLYGGKNFYELNYEQLKNALKKNIDALYYLHSLKTDYGLLVVRLKCKYFVADGLGAVMELPNQSYINRYSFVERIKKRIQIGVRGSYRNLLIHIRRIIFDNYYSVLVRINPPLFIVTSTQYTTKNRTIIVPKTLENRIVYTHSYDYDRFLEERKKERKEKCLLFCDSGFNDHDIDYEEKHGQTYTAQNGNTWEKLNVLFGKLEEYYHLPVVIAGHPHTRYASSNPTGRKLVFDSIGELARNAELFIVNTSTAISLAVLYDIPTLHVLCDDFKRIDYYGSVSLYDFVTYQSHTLKTGLLNLDDETQMSHPYDYIKKMDPTKRQEYIRKYIIDSNKTDKLVIEYIHDYLFDNGWVKQDE